MSAWVPPPASIVERRPRRAPGHAWKLYALRSGGELVELCACRGDFRPSRGVGTVEPIEDGLALARALAEVVPLTTFRTRGHGEQAALSAAAWEHLARRAIAVVR